MSANSFAFPPPPPPPPQATSAQFSAASNNSRGRGDQRWERGSRGRGRGRANSNQASRGGFNHGRGGTPYATVNQANNGSQYGGGYPLPNYPAIQQPRYPRDLHDTYSNPLPNYAPVATQPNHHQAYPYYPPTYANHQPQGGLHPYNAPIYDPQAIQQYQPQHAPSQYEGHRYASPPVAMGPPIRLGFGDQQAKDLRPFSSDHHGHAHSDAGHYASATTPPYHENSSYAAHSGRHRSSNQQRRGRGHFIGRGRAGAANSFHDSSRKPQVAPAVPSFGNPLPTKPPASHDEVKKDKKKKKKRSINQLGLTPKTDEHISSSEDEDADEELKLGTSIDGSGSGQELKFTYKGQTSTLQSSNDIASWIEERKKRFPTAARKAEKDARLQKIKEEREEQRQAFKAKKLLERQMRTLEKDKQATEQAAAEKSKLKVEKLRRRLEKEERRIAKAEAKSLKRDVPSEADETLPRDAKKMRLQSDPITSSAKDRNQESVDKEAASSTGNEIAVNVSQGPSLLLKSEQPWRNFQVMPRMIKEEQEEEPPSLIPDPLTPTSQPALPERETEPAPLSESTVTVDPATALQPSNQPDADRGIPSDGGARTNDEAIDIAVSASSSDTAVSSEVSSDEDDDDETTSSGSSSSGSDSDTEVLEAKPLHKSKPRRIAAPKRNNRQDRPICRDFLRTGRCRRVQRCRWRHALPERGQRKDEASVLARPERKSLHQRLVEQEEEKEKAVSRALEQQKHEHRDDIQTTVA